ncbi:MAG: phosphoribosylformylglycinamidine cyclo-ligase, partial [Synergistales bacterium]|nr:phosphoribosylformylglycinamidine cyclo-ligase [Synergistales bacterium]
ITGSGLLKLHRISGFGFEIDDPIEPQPIFRFLQEEGGVAEDEMYRTFNMGMGYAFIVPPGEEEKIISRLPGSKVVGEITENPGIRLKGVEIS